MKYIDRLEGTRLSSNANAQTVCRLLDWLHGEGVGTIPSKRGWAEILGMSETAAYNLVNKMKREGIIELTPGTGRKRSAIGIPQNGQLHADKIERYNKRKEEWKNKVWNTLRDRVGKEGVQIEDIKEFYEHWSFMVEDYKMLWEVEVDKNKKKYFIIPTRFANWMKNKKSGRVPTLPSASVDWKEEDRQMEEKMNKTRAEKADVAEYNKQRDAFLAQGHTLAEWFQQQKK